MKTIYLIGFQGKSFRDERYKQENALIRAGHVGIAFEGYEGSIIGFHPTSEAIEKIGGVEIAIEWLKAHNTLEGRLHEDYAIFVRAYELAQQLRDATDRDTTVYWHPVEVNDEEFERIRILFMQWYNQGTVFTYGFPVDPLPLKRDNCASFPRKLNLPVLDLAEIGKIEDYVKVLKQEAHLWKPEEDKNATTDDAE
jgi:hypothetical protein